ncbi:hypothetical protein [Streptomyces sp. NPDC086023]|uniref:hypothetical protein n=1 Tax=Streptomyces sp. NPDC086023 TaxID=3365746 RepID=UPI0037D079D7
MILDLTGPLGWSAGGQIAVAQAARRLAERGCRLELAAIPADGSLVPDATCPPVPVHCGLAHALAAHGAGGTVRHVMNGAPQGARVAGVCNCGGHKA